MSGRLGHHERGLLYQLRRREHDERELATIAITGGYSPSAAAYRLRARRMACVVASSWRPTSTGGQVRVETFALTDRGRAVADNLIHNAGTYRVGYCGELLGSIARDSFRASTYRRAFPYPGHADPAITPEYRAETERLGMAAPRAVLGTETRRAYDAIRERNAALAEGERAAREYGASKYPATRLAGLIPTDREPLDRVINALASGYAFTEDAHRRLRMLIAARREHDSGDEDDGAIGAALAECERLLRAQILGDEFCDPATLESNYRVAALAYAHGWTVSADELDQ